MGAVHPSVDAKINRLKDRIVPIAHETIYFDEANLPFRSVLGQVINRNQSGIGLDMFCGVPSLPLNLGQTLLLALRGLTCDRLAFKIGATGFEPATSWSQTTRSGQTELRPGWRLTRLSQDFEQPLEIVVGIEGQNDLTLLFTLQTDFYPR